MKGFLSIILLVAFLPLANASAQDTTPTPQEDKSKIFSLKLTDELIKELKENPEGLIAIIPVEQRGSIGRVKLFYEAPAAGLPLQPNDPVRNPAPGNDTFQPRNPSDRVASSRPSLDDNGFGGMTPINASRNSQSTILGNQNPPQATPNRSVYEANLPNNRNSNSGFGAPTTNGWPSEQPTNKNGFFPTTPERVGPNLGPNLPTTSPNSNWNTMGPMPQNNTPTVDDDLRAQHEIFKRQADELEARRLAEQKQREQKKLMDDVFAQRVRLEVEKARREWEAQQQASRQQDSLLTRSNYDRTSLNQTHRPISQVDHTTRTWDEPIPEHPANQLGSYGQRLVGDNNRSITRVAMAPRTADTMGSDPSLILPPAKTTVPTSTPKTNAENNSNVADAADDAHRRAKGKTEAFLLIGFLVSLGANFYLAWIARGFYTRYNDLADELRETFNATV